MAARGTSRLVNHTPEPPVQQCLPRRDHRSALIQHRCSMGMVDDRPRSKQGDRDSRATGPGSQVTVRVPNKLASADHRRGTLHTAAARGATTQSQRRYSPAWASRTSSGQNTNVAMITAVRSGVTTIAVDAIVNASNASAERAAAALTSNAPGSHVDPSREIGWAAFAIVRPRRSLRPSMRICSRSSKSETRGIRRRRVRLCPPGSKRTAATVHSKSSTAAILTIGLDSGEVSALGRHPLEQALTLSGDDLSNELGFG